MPDSQIDSILKELAEMDWDVGDQGRDQGFVVTRQGTDTAWNIEIEGWGLECLDGSYENMTKKARAKLKAVAMSWVRRRHAEGRYAALVEAGSGDAEFVTFSAFRFVPMSSLVDVPEEDIIYL